MSFGNYHKRVSHKHKRKNNNLITLVDKSIYIIALFTILANVPQLFNIWVLKNIEGVSLVSWIGFFIGSVFWLWYGLLHKEMPIILINILLILVQGGIVLGLLIY